MPGSPAFTKPCGNVGAHNLCDFVTGVTSWVTLIGDVSKVSRIRSKWPLAAGEPACLRCEAILAVRERGKLPDNAILRNMADARRLFVG
jgi:hypothetical protein